jgi:hypothetical protein
MARPLRLEFAGALHHVTARGDGCEAIFRADGDRRVILGSDAFVESRQAKIPSRLDLREVPQAKCRPVPRPSHDYDQAHADRDQAIAAAYASGDYTMQQSGD